VLSINTNPTQGLDRFGLKTINLDSKTASVVDSGNERFYASTLAQVGRAVVHILQHPAETANRYLAIASFNLSQNELIKVVEELTGQEYPVTSRANSAELQKVGEEKLAKGDYSAFLELLTVHLHADGAGNALAELPYEDLKTEVAAWLKRKNVL
jgi:hypothetical protein